MKAIFKTLLVCVLLVVVPMLLLVALPVIGITLPLIGTIGIVFLPMIIIGIIIGSRSTKKKIMGK